MTNFEGMQQGPRTEAASARAVEYKEGREGEMNRLADQYKEVQMKLIGLREDLKRGTEFAAQQKNESLDTLALKLRQDIQTQIGDLEIEKEELENSIKGKGGNPSDYTLQ